MQVINITCSTKIQNGVSHDSALFGIAKKDPLLFIAVYSITGDAGIFATM
jgi:hypothetical protein